MWVGHFIIGYCLCLSLCQPLPKRRVWAVCTTYTETNSSEIMMNMRWMLFLWVGDKGSTRQGYCYLWSWCGIQEDWCHHQVWKPT
jgi:hypothetical protein